jgi:hypothetical protein
MVMGVLVVLMEQLLGGCTGAEEVLGVGHLQNLAEAEQFVLFGVQGEHSQQLVQRINSL